MVENDASKPGSPTPISTPPDIPFAWDNPAEDQLFWQTDMVPIPKQTTTITDLFNRAFNQEFEDAAVAS